MTPSPAISIVIPTGGPSIAKERCLELTLAALSRDISGLPCEVIVVGAVTDMRSRDVVRQYGKNWTFIGSDQYHNRSASRNTGVGRSSGKYVVFLDDDTIVASAGAVSRAAEAASGVAFACGAKRFWTYPNWKADRVAAAIGHWQRLTSRDISLLPCGINRQSGYRDLQEYSFLGNFGAVERELFDSVGGFDEGTFGAWGREDVDLMLRLWLRRPCFGNLHEMVSVVHLNHALSDEDVASAEKSLRAYMNRERELGVQFCAGNLFGTGELDHNEVLVPHPHPVSLLAQGDNQ